MKESCECPHCPSKEITTGASGSVSKEFRYNPVKEAFRDNSGEKIDDVNEYSEGPEGPPRKINIEKMRWITDAAPHGQTEDALYFNKHYGHMTDEELDEAILKQREEDESSEEEDESNEEKADEDESE